MRYNLTSTMIAALTSTVVRPRYLAQIGLIDTTLHLSSGITDISWNGQVWLGNGLFQGMQEIGETSDLAAPNYNLVLGGADTSILSAVLGQSNQTYPTRVYLALVDSSEATLADPIILFDSEWDYATITDDGQAPKITVTCSSAISTMRRVHERRYTPESQAIYFKRDTGFRYAAAAADWSGFWGKSTAVPPHRKRKTGRH